MHSKHFKDENMWVHHCINCGDILYFFFLYGYTVKTVSTHKRIRH